MASAVPPGGPLGTDLVHTAAPAHHARPPHKPRKPYTSPRPPPRDPHFKEDHTLRVGNFNVLNLVNAGVTYYGRNHYSQAQVDRKVEWIGNQLKNMKAGICGFQEVFSVEPLERAIKLSGVYGPQAKLINFGANGTGPTVALVSNYPVLESHSISDFPPEALLHSDQGVIPIKKFNRPVLKCAIRLTSGDIITVFVAHLKSKRPIVSDELRHDPKGKAVGHALSLVYRAAEAAALRCLVVDDMSKTGRPVVVLGDLNDTVHSVTTEIIAGTPPWKKMQHEQKEEIWETLLWSTNEVQVRSSDRDVTYSHIHNGRYEVLDHVLVSQDFVRSYPDHFGEVQYLQLFNDHLIDATLSDDFGDVTQSDHGQVVAHIKIYPREQPPSPTPPTAHAAPSASPAPAPALPQPAPAVQPPAVAQPAAQPAPSPAVAPPAQPAAPKP